MGKEFELKYAASAADLEKLKRRYPDLTPIAMETTYYDNDAGDLGRLHWTFRRRMENGKSVCTLKTPAAGFGRNEWEVHCEDILAAVNLLLEQGAPKQLLFFAVNTGFHPCCGAKFLRLAGILHPKGCAVELALDQGVLLGGGKELPFTEVEVELKEGSEEAAVAFAQSLAAEFGLKAQPRSKVARARALADQ